MSTSSTSTSSSSTLSSSSSTSSTDTSSSVSSTTSSSSSTVTVTQTTTTILGQEATFRTKSALLELYKDNVTGDVDLVEPRDAIETLYGRLIFREVNSDTLLDGNDQLILANASSGEVKITPPYAPNHPGRILYVAKSDNSSNKVRVALLAGHIFLNNQDDTFKLFSNGIRWIRLRFI